MKVLIFGDVIAGPKVYVMFGSSAPTYPSTESKREDLQRELSEVKHTDGQK